MQGEGTAAAVSSPAPFPGQLHQGENQSPEAPSPGHPGAPSSPRGGGGRYTHPSGCCGYPGLVGRFPSWETPACCKHPLPFAPTCGQRGLHATGPCPGCTNPFLRPGWPNLTAFWVVRWGEAGTRHLNLAVPGVKGLCSPWRAQVGGDSHQSMLPTRLSRWTRSSLGPRAPPCAAAARGQLQPTAPRGAGSWDPHGPGPRSCCCQAEA